MERVGRTMIEQMKLAPGTSDKMDCMYCYWYDVPHNRCSPSEDVGFYKCKHCGKCNSFRPLTDKDAEREIKDAYDKNDPPVERVTFNRWRWRKL